MSVGRLATALILTVIMLLPSVATSQNPVRIAPFEETSIYLNETIIGDTLANGARRDPDAVYVLQRGKIYLANALMRNTGWTIRIKANDSVGTTDKPIVFLYPNPTTQLPPGQLIDMRGDAVISNLLISGYFELLPENVSGLQGGLIQTSAAGLNLTIDSCILLNTNGNHVRTNSAPRNVLITNCVFGNMGYLGRSNLGAGKAIDLRAGSVDTMLVLNCTFVNWQDRIIRHFSSTANIGFLRFEHNTMVNGMSYHGLLSLGRMGYRGIIRDNLFVDGFALGQDSDAVRQAEFTDSDEKDAFDGPRMTWIFSVPNDSTQWTVDHNFYEVTAAGQSFYDSASILPIVADPPLVVGSPLTYHINGRIADSTTAFQLTDATLPNVPDLMVAMMKWYRRPAAPPDSGSGKTKVTTTWKSQFDFDRRGYQYFSDTLDCAYSTGNALYTAGLGGYPVGDLNWFPSRKAAWLADPISSVAAGGQVPAAFSLSQNYPNPFNPSTHIDFTLATAAKVTLEVFDVLGRHVATLITGENRGAGKHSVTFNAAGLASGVYLYRLSTGTAVATAKMMLLK
jgi:hypothetical protein